MLVAERAHKHQQIIAIMDEFELDAVVLRKSPNTAWFSGGRVHVPSSLESSCFDIIINRDSYYFHTNAIEAPRLLSGDLQLNIAPEVVTELAQWSSKLIS